MSEEIIIDKFDDEDREERKRSFTVNSKLQNMKSKIQVRRSEKQLDKFVPVLLKEQQEQLNGIVIISQQQQDLNS